MSPFTDARMHLGIELGGAGAHPGAAGWSGLDPTTAAGVRHHLALVLAAARRGLDFVSLPGPDALTLATRLVPLVGGIGLVPAIPITGTEPTRLAEAVAALDVMSAGRAGWEPVVADPDPDPAPDAAGWRRAGETIEQVAHRRRADDRTVQSVDFAAGTRGARPPLLVLRADEPAALPVVARWADVVRIAAPGLDSAHQVRDRVRAAVTAAGRDPDGVAVMLDVEVHLAADRHRAGVEQAELDAISPAPPSSMRVLGSPADLADLVGAAVRLGAADGITFRPLVLPADLRRIAVELIPMLAGRGLLRAGWSGLRAPARRPVVEAGPPWRRESA